MRRWARNVFYCKKEHMHQEEPVAVHFVEKGKNKIAVQILDVPKNKQSKKRHGHGY